MNIIVTWMYSSPGNENILHAQMGSASGSQKIQNLYWRCVFLLFESSTRLNPGARHILFINQNPPGTIDGVDINRLIQQFNIEIIEFPTITKSPLDYYGAWNTQFIVLDVLDWLKKNINKEDNIFILDSDIIFNKPINEKLLSALKDHGALLYSIDYTEDHDINGLTLFDLVKIAKEINTGFPSDDFTYSGGEFICCTGREIPKIARIARKSYRLSLERHKKGLKKFNEEAHLLSYVYHELGYQTHTGNQFIKRMWTNRSIYSNIDGTEFDLVLWHLPAEKKRGFVNVFKSFKEFNKEYKLTIKDFAPAYRIEETFSSKTLRYCEQFARFLWRILKNMTNKVSRPDV